MPVVSASFLHATDLVSNPSPGPVCRPPPGRVPPSVHAREDQQDQHNDNDYEHPGVRHVTGPGGNDRDTAQHHHAPIEELHVAGSTVSRYVLSVGGSSGDF